MKKCVLFFFILFAVFEGCKTTKKIIVPEKNALDSTKTVQEPTTIIDSFALAKQTLTNTKSALPAYTFFYAKVKLDYESADESMQATAYIRIRKDSIIWISMTGQLGFEGARILISPDSLVFINRIDKTILMRPVSFLRDALNIPIDFYTLQDLITGNALFDDTTITHYQIGADTTEIILSNRNFQNLVSINSKTNTIFKNKLYEDSNSSLKNATFNYTGFDNTNGFNFPTERGIHVLDKNIIDIALSFKQFNFNEIQTFPFNIPKNYSVK